MYIFYYFIPVRDLCGKVTKLLTSDIISPKIKKKVIETLLIRT